MTSEIFDYASDQILIVGYMPDIAPLLESARVLIAPLRFGAGMKGKIGQALSYGLPVVTTTIGAEGFGLTHGREAMIADEPGAFANAIFQVYTDKKLWNKLSVGGHLYVQENLSPRVVQEKLYEAIGSLVDCSFAC
jgi:glycosyltransferase involved in cell wall biosynthesis